MNTNDVLHKSVKRLMDNGLSENKAWLQAYMELVNEGVLTNPYIAMDDHVADDIETFYIFAHSTMDNQDYTYVSARYRNSVWPISINLYDKFYDYLINAIEQDIKDKELKQDMMDGLSMVFTDICEGYVRQLNDEVVSRLKINEVPVENHCDYYEKTMRGIKDLFDEYEVNHLSFDMNTDKEGKTSRGTFLIKNITVGSRPIYWTINRIDNVATVSI